MTPSPDEPLKAGTWVKILDSLANPGRIVEYRGRLAPGGVRVYRVRVGRKPSQYPEVPETVLEVLPGDEQERLSKPRSPLAHQITPQV